MALKLFSSPAEHRKESLSEIGEQLLEQMKEGHVKQVFIVWEDDEGNPNVSFYTPNKWNLIGLIELAKAYLAEECRKNL